MQIIALLITRCGCRRRLKLQHYDPVITLALTPELSATTTAEVDGQPGVMLDARRFQFVEHRTSKSGKFLFVTYVERL